MYKFRTMYKNAHEERDKLKSGSKKNSPLFKLSEDPRIFVLDEAMPRIHNRWHRQAEVGESARNIRKVPRISQARGSLRVDEICECIAVEIHSQPTRRTASEDGLLPLTHSLATLGRRGGDVGNHRFEHASATEVQRELTVVGRGAAFRLVAPVRRIWPGRDHQWL